MQPVLFCHGLESGPHGSKYHALVAAGYTVLAPDCQGMSLKERVAVVAKILVEHNPYVVGSSYGGVTAVLAAMSVGVTLPGLVLCAPALEHSVEAQVRTESLTLVGPTIIVHGGDDEIIPLPVSEAYSKRTGACLVVVEDGHRLEKSIPVILSALGTLVSE